MLCYLSSVNSIILSTWIIYNLKNGPCVCVCVCVSFFGIKSDVGVDEIAYQPAIAAVNHYAFNETMQSSS